MKTWWSLSLQPVRHVPNMFLSTFLFQFCSVFISFYAREARFYFPHDVCRGPNQWQIFRPLVFTRTPGCFARQSGQSLALDLGHSELDQLHWLHKWLTRLKSLLWFPPQCAEGRLPLAESLVGGRVTSLYSLFISIPFISCHLVDLAVLFSVVQRPVLNCIKLYRLCKKLNVA